MSCVVWCVVSPHTRVLCALSVCVLQCNHSQTIKVAVGFSRSEHDFEFTNTALPTTRC